MILAYAIDALWTTIAIVGVFVSSWAMTDSYIDRRAQELRGTDGLERAMISLNLRSAHASFYLHTFFLILGIFAFAMATPAEATPTYALLVSGYIFVAAANVRAVGLNQLDRLRLRQGRLP